jgi:hypothetical protein
MTAHVLVTGTLFRPPEQRTSKAGKPFVTATIRTKDDDGQAGEYEKDGQKRISLGVVADHVLVSRQPAKQRAHDTDARREPAFNDGIPW